MTSALSTRQGLLTKAASRLNSLLDDAQYQPRDGPLETPTDHEERKQRIRTEQLRLRKARKVIEMEQKNVDTALQAYNEEADTLATDTPHLTDIMEKVKNNSAKAEELLERAIRSRTRIEENLEELEAAMDVDTSTQDTPRIKLAPVPIPTFNGKVWEWESFWSAFEYSVHSRNMDDVYKMNYLVNAMKGEALDSLKKFEISGNTYQAAIEHLKSKYGNKELLVTQLVRRLEKTRARSKRMEDQQKLCEEISSIVNQLQLKGEGIDGALLQQQVLSKFTEGIQRQVLRKKRESDDRTTKVLLKTVEAHIQTELDIQRYMEPQIHDPESTPKKEQSASHHPPRPATMHRHYEKDSSWCFFCERKGHSPKSCPVFKSREQRIEQMKKLSLCRNCGGAGHFSSECTKGACRLCDTVGHHTSICKKLHSSGNEQAPAPKKMAQTKAKARSPTAVRQQTNVRQNLVATTPTDKAPDDFETVLCMKNTATYRTTTNAVLVGEAYVLNSSTNALECVHVLLDTGADRSFITEALAERLKLKSIDTITLKISTFGSKGKMEKTCRVANLQIFDYTGMPYSFSVAQVEYLTEPLQRSKLSEADKRYLANHDIELSVNPYAREIQPEILLGCNDTFELMDIEANTQRTLPSGLRLIPSRLGYLITGQMASNQGDIITSVNSLVSSNDEDYQEWEQFLTLESTGVNEFTGSKEHEQEIVHDAVWRSFEETVELHEDGYYVRLPWKEEASTLPDNKAIAYRRLCAILAKLQSRPEILEQYHKTFLDQAEKGVIEEVEPDLPRTGNIVHYLSHQPVITPDKEFTKLRIVFDASAHFKDRPSLNNVLYQGPVILPMICDILLRFRIGSIAIIADVEKAFLQIRLHPKDRDATCCLWVRDVTKAPEGENLVQYRFTRVTFGLNCSPFLLAATIRHHLQAAAQNKKIAKELMPNIYVDNVILSASDDEEAVLKCKEANAIFEEMKMNLRGFQTNSQLVNDAIPVEDRSLQSTTKVLGISWDSQKDTLTIRGRFREKTDVTKRTVCEQIASIYDPLGWLTPLMLRSKLFLQHLWKSGYDWDTPLLSEDEQQWTQIRKDVDDFVHVMMRKTAPIGSTVKLAIFSDASSQAMASCAYIIVDSKTHLIFAKSRLPNAKSNPTIPKMEINAVTMAARMAHMLNEALNETVSIESITILTDSEIALGWLAKHPVNKDAGVLVRNRIMEIRKITADMQKPIRFGHVNTEENPADCATRGLSGKELRDHFWWTGPDFLKSPESSWPKRQQHFSLPQDIGGEAEETKICLVGVESRDEDKELIDWSRHNSLSTAQQTVALVLRFLRRLTERVSHDLSSRLRKNIAALKPRKEYQYVTARERDEALQVIVRNHQAIHVTEQLRKSMKNLNLKPDKQGLLCCYGRLDNAQISELTKRPLFIMAKTPLAACIIKKAHLPLHRGTSHTIATIRQKFWIPKLRQQVQTTIRKCIPCQKINNLPFPYPPMGPLPEKRVVRTKPFENTGIDYFGPLLTRQGNVRSKAYGIILTCMTTRLIHIELVQEMSTEVLLMALRRFFARRGVPTTITSDNGPSFLLADQILKDAVQSVTDNERFPALMASRGIEWTTITPYAPWQGAFYERLIKSVKDSLYKTIGNRVVTKEELETLLVEIGGCLNCRPLTYQGSLFEEVRPLRPIDFLVRDFDVTYPFEALEDDMEDSEYLPCNQLLQFRTRRQVIDALNSTHKLTENYWAVWHKEYLSSLREFHKWHMDKKGAGTSHPDENTIVLLVDENQPRNTWRIGRISALKKSSDGAVREVDVTLPSGHVLRRPVNLLVPLEVDDVQEELASTKTTHIEAMQESEDTIPVKENSEVKRYDLRERRPVNYKESYQGQSKAYKITTMAAILMLTFLFGSSYGKSLQCVKGGVQIVSNGESQYEICAEGHCIVRKHPPPNGTLFFPPEITLHDHRVQWKRLDGRKIEVIETTCPAISFCDNVQCWFCTANAFNPECSPVTALMVWTVTLYIVIAVIYTICYVPLTVGKPCRLIVHIIFLGTPLSKSSGVYSKASKLRSLGEIIRSGIGTGKSTNFYEPH